MNKFYDNKKDVSRVLLFGAIAAIIGLVSVIALYVRCHGIVEVIEPFPTVSTENER